MCREEDPKYFEDVRSKFKLKRSLDTECFITGLRDIKAGGDTAAKTEAEKLHLRLSLF